jgi:uncharacterized membrane protein SirB2
MASVGAFVASRRPRNATGWLFLAAGLVMVGDALARGYAIHSLFGRRLPGTHLAAWLGFWLWMLAWIFIALVLIVFPTGRAPTRLWRWVARIAVVLVPLTCLAALPTLRAPTQTLMNAADPSAVPGGALLGAVGQFPAFFIVPVAFIALVVRFVRARGVERQQMKWFVFGTSLLVVAALIMIALGFFFGVEDPISNPFAVGSILLGFTAIPLTAGIAIMRYRLYDIDRIISRTLSYALVTALLVGAYVGLVVLFQATTRPLLGKSDLAIAASTLIVAALFVPLRRRIQNAVDHRFNRRRYDAAGLIDSFGARLRDEIDINELSSDLQTLVHQTMEPAHVSVWLRDRTSSS